MKRKILKLTDNTRNRIGERIQIRWGVSRGRDTEGYTTASLTNGDGRRVASCNGGGYDMRGTVLGNWIARTFSAELVKLTPGMMPENSHWQRERARYCAGKCKEVDNKRFMDEVLADIPKGKLTPNSLPKLAEDCWECPTCGGKTEASNAGQTINDGRGFYGLSFHDPNFDPGKAVIGKDCNDCTFSGKSGGKTVAEAEAAGDTLGLERYQAFYKASSKTPSRRHTVPLIDGGCGESSVLRILNAIGLCLEKVHDSSKLDVYIVREYKPN